MTYIVNDKCIKCKLMDCVEVCPVDCFYEGENILVIKPDECIDCGVCEPECPINAIEPDTNEGTNKWVEINTKYGEYIIFDSGLKHGNQINIENKTRISFDFRIVPKFLYKNNPNTSSINTNMKFKVGEYYKSTEEL